MTTASKIITAHNSMRKNANVMEVVARLLDPTPLTDQEVEDHIEWAKEEPVSIVNFHHPLYIGWHHDELPPGIPEDLVAAFDTRSRIKMKHQHLHRGEVHESIFLVERPYRPIVAYLLVRRGLHRYDDDAMAEFLIDLWTDTESARAHVWSDLLDAFPIGPPRGDTEILDSSGTTKVYRGIALGEDLEVDGHNLSWTTDKHQAQWFAARFRELEGRENPVVLIGTVENDKVLFCTTRRGEYEVVSRCVEIVDMETP